MIPRALILAVMVGMASSGCKKEPEVLSEYSKNRLQDPDTIWASSVTITNVKVWCKTDEYIIESLDGERVRVEHFESGEWTSIKWTPLNESRDTEPTLGGTANDEN